MDDFDVADVLPYLPATLNRLTRAQRLTVADELVADAAGRAEALQTLPTQQYPATDTSRAWQAHGAADASSRSSVG